MIDLIIKINYIVGKIVERRIANIQDQLKKLRLLQKLSDFYSKQYAGILYSHFIEEELIKLSKNVKAPNNIEVDYGHVLHVATMVGADGGHSRIILNWIANQPNKRHSLFLNTDCKVPDWLADAVHVAGGSITVNKHDGYIDKASFLKEHSLGFENIILHVHTNDMLPILAYGSGFDRPVALFNHADHTFWLGSSIADKVFDLNSYSSEITKNLRGAKSNSPLPIVLSNETHTTLSKHELREKYGLPQNSRIYVSMASKHKFVGQSNVFFKTIPLLLDDSSILLLMGPSNKKQFKQLAKQTRGKVIPLGYQDKDQADEILRLSDIYIDSFPISSFTSMLQAIRAKVPVVTTFAYALPDSLLDNRISDLSEIKALTETEIIDRYLKPAEIKLIDHSGIKWQEALKSSGIGDKHSVSLPRERYSPHPYIRFVYSASVKRWQWMRRTANLALTSYIATLTK